MSIGARPTADFAADQISDRGFSNFVRDYGFGGILWAVFAQAILTIEAAGDLLLMPFRALAEGLVSLISAIIGEPVTIVEAGASTAIRSLTTGLAADLGVFAFPLAVAVLMIGIWTFIVMVQRIEFSPLVFIRSRIGR